MSIILITGQPGGGKTALCVDMLANDPQFKGRPLFIMGIPDLKIEHNICPPVSEWTEIRKSPEDETISLAYFTFPENALVVIDEAQRVYRPRSVGTKVPPEVAAFETHRHTGIDFILLTQHPGLLDANIRKLIGRHIHIRVTALGRYKHEWPELGDPESTSSRAVSAREKYKLPKRAFDLYKSSQLHTKIKTKIPLFVWMFIGCIILFAVLGVVVYKRVTAHMAPPKIESATPPGQTTSHSGKPELSQAEYFASFKPREKGLYHTAPRYDSVTVPVDAPWPTGCMVRVATKTKPETCRCVDQQGNNYATTHATCRSIVDNGIFKDWGEKEAKKSDEKPRQSDQPRTVQQQQQPQYQNQPAPPPVIQQADNRPPIVPDSSPWRFQPKT